MATVINVGGTSRSGSTMLHAVLGSAPNAFACGEVISWFRPSKTHHFSLDCSCGNPSCPVWGRIGGVEESEFYAHALKELKVDVLVDSSKSLSWLLDAHRWTSKRGDIRTTDLFVWKSPVALSYSFWKRTGDVMFWRSEFVKYYTRAIEVGLPLLAVNFGEFTQDPGKKVAEINAALKLEVAPAQERFWEGDHHFLFGSMGVRKQVESADSKILQTESYPAEFQKELPALEDSISSDTEVQELIKALSNADVSLAAQAGTSTQEFSGPRIYPAWYYVQRVKSRWRRQFPSPSDLDTAARVATIPTSGDDPSAASQTPDEPLAGG